MTDDTMRDARHCAPVLARMIDILVKDENTTFGTAFERAQLELGVVVPRHMEATILATAVKIIVDRKIPGAPDA